MPDSRFEVRPLFLQVHDLLARRIAVGEWLPGQQLPDELQLATELGISAGTVRKAIDELEMKEIVIRREGQGTFVGDNSAITFVARFLYLRNEMNELLEGQTSSASAKRATASAQESDKLQISEGDEVIRIDRVRLYKQTPFMAETCVFPCRLYKLLPARIESYPIVLLAQVNGILLRDPVESIRAVGADVKAAATLQVEAGAPVLLIERIINSINGQCVAWKTTMCNTQHLHIGITTD